MAAPGNWMYERGGSGSGAGGLVIGFIINNGSAGVNIGPMLPAPRSGSLTRCVVVVKAPGGADLIFTIRRDNVAIFDAPVTVPASAAGGDLLEFTNFTTVPFPVALDDIFSIDITQGSAAWKCTVQLE